ncbi:hypothetical protein CQA49_09000 [Helicobacter sp. MIT 00-7814]|uniref:hypothetical protein n=1 Tax=unclassified Helicobacter TaxID=2593540 RepID=UPI000E1F3984|nr:MULTISPECIES: hypothetical protein [unclassified Helicobacter]RDU51966.1 hypothetical protein CQA49_09000 [Helicobacter sp. MIT 00-7814]RDU54136.1 hypothetical protein CQA37_05855 [Helicobacter sp. MIT 99-10781]
MGYRPNIVKEYKVEYGNTLSGYNYGYDKLSEFFDKLGVEYYEDEGNTLHEVSSSDLIALEARIDELDLNEDEKDNLHDLIQTAKSCAYAKDHFVRIHWF